MTKVKILKSTTTGGVYYEKNTIVTVQDSVASTLVASGIATTTLSLVKSVTAATGVVAKEEGDEIVRKTTLTIAEFTQAIASAALGFGKKLCDMPEGAIKIEQVVARITTKGATCTSQPIIGVGTVVASGAVSVLSGTPTFVDVMTGFTGTAVSSTGSTSFKADTATAGVLDGTSTAKSLYLNMAAGWAVTESLTISGYVDIFWKFLEDN